MTTIVDLDQNFPDNTYNFYDKNAACYLYKRQQAFEFDPQGSRTALHLIYFRYKVHLVRFFSASSFSNFSSLEEKKNTAYLKMSRRKINCKQTEILYFTAALLKSDVNPKREKNSHSSVMITLKFNVSDLNLLTHC